MAIYAVGRDREIGIDIEQIHGNFGVLEVGRRFFSASEVSVLQGLPVHAQRDAFFNCWTRKEAYIKARGEGLSLPLDQFDVTLEPGRPAVLLATRPDPNEARRWRLQALDVPSGYAAALAVEGQELRVVRC